MVWNEVTEFQTYHALRLNKVHPSVAANAGWWPFLELHGGGVVEAPWLPETLSPYLELEMHKNLAGPCQLLLFSDPTLFGGAGVERLWKLVGFSSTSAYLHVRSPPPRTPVSLSRARIHTPSLPPPPLLSFR